MDKAHRDRAAKAALQFVEAPTGLELEGLGDGNINDTYLVRCPGRSFVLQRINPHVFPRPELVVANFQAVTAHLAGRTPEGCPQWREIHLIPTIAGESSFREASGDLWRAQTYLDGTTTFSIIDSPERARQVGLAVGCFHRLLADLSPGALYETLPGFHVLAVYLDHFDRIKEKRQVRRSVELKHCLGMVARYRGRMDRLRRAQEKGLLVPHIIHGDPKAANVLFDRETGQALCLIDLDTVRPGILHYDIGDCLRSCCNPAGEKGTDAVRFDADLAREILAGYFTGAGPLISPRDKEYVHEAVCLLSFELGLRLLTDFLGGNRYFRIEDPEDNLRRSLRQFSLLALLIDRGDIFRSL